MRVKPIAIAVVLGIMAVLPTAPVVAWDSAKFKLLSKIIRPTHSYLTEYAVDSLSTQFPEQVHSKSIIVEGANQEMHELPVPGTLYGVDLMWIRQSMAGPLMTLGRGGGA
jgi:hypothetical protein